ncbi:fibrinogen-like protein A [Dysidea avara]|uniref:fibrinogen-like protein A n=1 Tax=Dysidea avara TaxID=196820 RepID=UPI00331C3FB2
MTTSTTIILLLVILFGAVAQDTNNDVNIENCCNLGFRPSVFSEITNKPKQYKLKNFCGNNQSTITKVYCDTITDGGGWLVVQRRIDGSVDFNRDWVDYEDGFGTLPVDDQATTGEFWIGLYSLHCLTYQGHWVWELRIDYTFTNGTKGYLSYSNFRVGPATGQYLLTISGFDGVKTDPITGAHILNGMKFTTRDRDNDGYGLNCAVHNHGRNAGGWWYNFCSLIHPNHQYNHGETIHLNNRWFPLPFIEIKIRPMNCII